MRNDKFSLAKKKSFVQSNAANDDFSLMKFNRSRCNFETIITHCHADELDYVHTVPARFENGAKNITFRRCGHTVPERN